MGLFGRKKQQEKKEKEIVRSKDELLDHAYKKFIF